MFLLDWDKRFCLTQVESDGFEKIYFFGDKTFKVSIIFISFKKKKTQS